MQEGWGPYRIDLVRLVVVVESSSLFPVLFWSTYHSKKKKKDRICMCFFIFL